ncbi:MAG: 4-hydroxy-3-methylbut-2-enyl diphosphate reductase [Candidatus Omnitrophica bacterium]|nr:4-hydroxy-3-methylbut-2-enyl diphosphate reductase [Candidatus Omnitrophota bacterium]
MEIKVSDTIGFCFGVKKAVDMSKEALSRNKETFSIGPIIHNPQVIDDLLKRGLKVLNNTKAVKRGVVIISSHGAGAKLKDKRRKSDLKILDATCPFVKRIQEIVKKLHKDGYRVIIVGKRAHPEVKALVDVTDGKAMVVKDTKEVKGMGLDRVKTGVVSQSTYSQSTFFEIVSLLLKKPFSEIRIFNTICADTIKRQDRARDLAKTADVVIVVGGKNSSNTQRLAEVCREEKSAYHIEDKDEIDPAWFSGKKSVAVTSGASTPDWVVHGVVEKIRRYC